MQLTIIVPDNTIIIDGRALPIDCSTLDPNIRIVQWYDDHGEIEFDNVPGQDFRRNGKINSLSGLSQVIEAWQELAARFDAEDKLKEMPAHEAKRILARIDGEPKLKQKSISEAVRLIQKIETDPTLKSDSLGKAVDKILEIEARPPEPPIPPISPGPPQ